MSCSYFLERCGEFFFSRMRPLFFFALLAIPLLLTAFLLFSANRELEELEVRFAKAARKEKIASERRGKRVRFLRRYAQSNPYFLDQKIEAFPLLQAEKERLESLLHHPAFPASSELKTRLAFIQSNRLTFTEENIRSSAQCKEVEEKQRYPVQMDESDLLQVLSLIEDVPIGSFIPVGDSPQLIVKELRIKKIETPLHTQVLEVDMDLLKREFLK